MKYKIKDSRKNMSGGYYKKEKFEKFKMYAHACIIKY